MIPEYLNIRDGKTNSVEFENPDEDGNHTHYMFNFRALDEAYEKFKLPSRKNLSDKFIQLYNEHEDILVKIEWWPKTTLKELTNKSDELSNKTKGLCKRYEELSDTYKNLSDIKLNIKKNIFYVIPATLIGAVAGLFTFKKSNSTSSQGEKSTSNQNSQVSKSQSTSKNSQSTVKSVFSTLVGGLIGGLSSIIGLKIKSEIDKPAVVKQKDEVLSELTKIIDELKKLKAI